MAEENLNKDDVLSLDSEEESEFSGFEPLHNGDTEARHVGVSNNSDVVGSVEPCKSDNSKKKGKARLKTNKSSTVSSLAKSVNKSSRSAQAGSAKAKQTVGKKSSKVNPPKNKSSNIIDLDNLSNNDIMKLRQIIGVDNHEMADEEDIQYVFGDSLNNLPEVHVEFENDGPDSDVEVFSSLENIPPKPYPKRPLRAIENEINSALFEPGSTQNSSVGRNEVVTDDFTWQLPKLKIPQKGQPISASLASLINVACTSQCETEDIINKYKLPSNCDKLAPPLVNGEIWSEFHKKAQTYDKAFRDIQSLIASGISPILELLSVLKDQIESNSKARTLISDSITLLGQAQFNLSLRRRYMIRPHLKKKYANLCNINTPISTFLFGDDVQKEIKKCDTSMSVAKEQYSFFGPQRMRGRVRGRYTSHRGYGYNYNNFNATRGYNRYQPYGRQPQHFSQYRFPVQYQYPKKAKKSATVTSPEDMAS
ncbi:MAG: hypothetical protein N0E48_14100 [Candidatus Thiodiazotropha endolucinida]|nr:hypothetical protein [Candidatus Thiodiazotropha taylori]MCW4344464.1 hypothetical protein [Candidatus Thiodiazotropha endolucinida]